MVHAHYSELDAIYAFNSQPSQCLYYVIIRIAPIIIIRIAPITPAPIIRIMIYFVSNKEERIPQRSSEIVNFNINAKVV